MGVTPLAADGSSARYVEAFCAALVAEASNERVALCLAKKLTMSVEDRAEQRGKMDDATAAVWRLKAELAALLETTPACRVGRRSKPGQDDAVQQRLAV